LKSKAIDCSESLKKKRKRKKEKHPFKKNLKKKKKGGGPGVGVDVVDDKSATRRDCFIQETSRPRSRRHRVDRTPELYTAWPPGEILLSSFLPHENSPLSSLKTRRLDLESCSSSSEIEAFKDEKTRSRVLQQQL
jgi:hypothetical protein